MKKKKGRIERDKKTVKVMIKKYCQDHHKIKGICEECLELLNYSEIRLEHCAFGEEKPVCSKCPIHCYKPNMREKIRVVMRYAGPRMLYSHPIMAFRHLFRKRQSVEDPRGKKKE